MPFDRWAFIHGNWALNASDPEICEIENEMSIIRHNGGIGDFTFPAGRGHCDPALRSPFTCLPVARARAFDDESADPRPIEPGSGVMTDDRFFIWNSPLRAKFASLDYASRSTRELLKKPEQILRQWIGNGVLLDGCLFIKTHAHSMNTAYSAESNGARSHIVTRTRFRSSTPCRKSARKRTLSSASPRLTRSWAVCGSPIRRGNRETDQHEIIFAARRANGSHHEWTSSYPDTIMCGLAGALT